MSKKYKSVGELPNNPYAMPPPYWRSSSAIWHINEGLSEVAEQLSNLYDAKAVMEEKLDDFFDHHPDLLEDDSSLVESEEFWNIISPVSDIEHKIKLRVERTIFMSAIEAEDVINMVSVYNLNHEVSEIIEKLSPLEKIVILGSTLHGENIKGTIQYENLKELMKYRNAFAHGHCTDRPVKSLRHNHLISPDHYPTIPKEIEKLKKLVQGFLKVTEYVRSISKNEYASGESGDEDDLKPILKEISSYSFEYEVSGNGESYNIYRN